MSNKSQGDSTDIDGQAILREVDEIDGMNTTKNTIGHETLKNLHSMINNNPNHVENYLAKRNNLVTIIS
jgi:GMP synthase PP-ATPase subunit